MELARRGFLTGLGAGLICAPAIVRATSLMAIKPIEIEVEQQYINTAAYSNTLLTMREITREVIKLFRNSNEFLKNAGIQYNEQFAQSHQIGDTLTIKGLR